MVDGSLYHTYVKNEAGLVGESYVEGNEALALGVSSSLISAPGANPEQFIGFALSTCFNATLRIVQHRQNLTEDSQVRTRVDIVKDNPGYKFMVEAQILLPSVDGETAQQIVDTALGECPVAKLLKDNDTVSFRIVSDFTDDPAYGE
ncbi:OsmC family protein [Lacticaseibacillus brantae]|uniref:Redox protein, regulator of disulfide bond formation n=1 Tax=Lacticaseibacillus brantae DSM 23927 TaxID=1423727 RepID=A0A0R2B8G0_9LACO|nr:OsmC family protein [Lacticaseibacillus brantae]KRM72665.1 redox protein, regulator of disulfide bond formation [Lacticaseibacillus brantae DSM 23927]